MLVLVGFAVTALGFSFLCSLLEAVLLSVTPSYVAQLEQTAPTPGRALRKLKMDIDQPLAAILSLNTIAHTVGAAGAGAQAQKLWGSDILAAASAVLTILILVISEIIPKTLGAVHWRRLGPWAARILVPMIWVLYPLVILSRYLTRALAGRRQGAAVSREEIAALARLGDEQGVLGESESRILTNLFRAKSLRVRDIMTPRTVLLRLKEDTKLRDIIDQPAVMRFSRIPIWRANEDDIVGYVLKDELLLHAARDELGRSVGEFVRDLLVVPEGLSAAGLFERFLQGHEHIALVVDEYGSVVGVATMEDVVETLLGMEIVDEADAVQDMRALARARWFQRARRLGLAPPETLAALEKERARASSRPPPE